jgi:hypothetical protein
MEIPFRKFLEPFRRNSNPSKFCRNGIIDFGWSPSQISFHGISGIPGIPQESVEDSKDLHILKVFPNIFTVSPIIFSYVC